MTQKKNSPPSSKATEKKQHTTSREQRTSHGIRLLGLKELQELGIETSDELVISLGQTRRPGSSRKDKQ